MCDYICYMLVSLDTNHTYIGSTNNCINRLRKHNSGRGAKYTKGQTWVPVMTVSGFHHKNACLSFEAGWKKLSKKRCKQRLLLINELGFSYQYSKDSRWNRVLDLLYFMHNVTLLDTKFKLNATIQHPLNPPELQLNIFFEKWIRDLPWPYFVLIS